MKNRVTLPVDKDYRKVLMNLCADAIEFQWIYGRIYECKVHWANNHKGKWNSSNRIADICYPSKGDSGDGLAIFFANLRPVLVLQPLSADSILRSCYMGSLCLRKSLIHDESNMIFQEKYCSLLALGLFSWGFFGFF